MDSLITAAIRCLATHSNAMAHSGRHRLHPAANAAPLPQASCTIHEFAPDTIAPYRAAAVHRLATHSIAMAHSGGHRPRRAARTVHDLAATAVTTPTPLKRQSVAGLPWTP